MTLLNAQGKILYANPVETLLGYSLDEYLHIALPTLLHADDLPRIRTFWQTLLATPNLAYTLEVRGLHKQGHYVWLEITATNLLQTPEIGGILLNCQNITSRKASEALFQATFEQPAVGMAHITPDGHWLRVNQRCCAMLGYSLEELLGKPFHALVHPDDLARAQQLTHQLLQGEISTFAMHKRCFHKDGSLVWINLTMNLARTASGAPDYFVAVVEDITRLKHAEQALLQQEAERRQAERTQAQNALDEERNLLRTLIDAMPNLIYIKDLEHRFVICNVASGHKLHGVSPETLIGKTDFDLFPQPLAEQFLAAEQAILASGQPLIAYEEQVVGPQGNVIWLATTKMPLRNLKGDLIGLAGASYDITAQKAAYEALRTSEARYRLLADNVTDWVTRISPRGEYIYASPSTQMVLGYEPEELLGVSGFPFIHPDDQERVLNHHWRAVEDRLATPLLTYRRRHKAGHYIWLETKSRAICEPETGELLEFVTSSRDITERKRVEEALHAKIEEERIFQHYLKTLHEITIELTTIDQLDDFYRRVIELGIERLGFERLGLLFYDAEHDLALGSYGTDAQGRVVAEHHLRFDPGSLTSILRRALMSPEHFAFDAEAQLFTNGRPTGTGWNAVAVLWNGHQSLGWLAADNAVSQQPLAKLLLDMLVLYSSTIGTLLTRKQLETALRKSEEKFRLLVEAAPLAIIITDQTGQMTLVNRSAEQLFGYPRAELLGQTVDLLVPAATHTEHAAKRATYMATPRVRQMGIGQELYARHQNGHEFPVEIELSYVDTPSGIMVMSFVLDVSERKRAAEALRAQRDFLQLVINSVPTLITVKDQAGYFRLANEAVAAIHKITPAAMIGKTDNDLNPNPAEVAFFRQKDREVLESGQPLFIPEQTILGRYYQTNKIPLKQTTGQADQLLVVSSDITVHKQAEAALQQALTKEKELGELKSRFVSMASHEFRTPLASILAVTETLTAYRHKLSDEQIAERLTDIREQVNYLKTMMEDVLQLARIQAHRVELKRVQLDLVALCRSVLDEFQSRPDVQHQLLFQPDMGVCEAALDKKLMRQMITNLVANAIKYSSADKAIQVKLRVTGSILILQVQDEGIGIPAADLKHLFQPFHRAANVGEIAGTGLGLTITKEAIEQHGGTITVESQVGVGTTFTVSLPIPPDGDKAYAKNFSH